MEPKRVVVSGYATLDYVVQLAESFYGTGTVFGELGVSGAWPRAGGAALYASRRIAAAGHRAFALTWVGDDGDGGHYLRACQRSQICCDAIDRQRATKTPRCILVYRPDGDYGCLLDTGSGDGERLSERQVEIIREAEHMCVAVGPPAATRAIVEICSPAIPLSWIAKLDLPSYPSDLRARLAQRANLIFCNASEREFIEAAFEGSRPDNQVIIETLGSAGVLIDGSDGRRVLPANAIRAHDTTGAGDTLAGEVIAQLMGGQVSIDVAVERGMKAARDLLASRIPDQGQEIL
ncbi:carbohydrate kinase family protein [Sphingopyxis sp. DBS4]|jgi:ribokinase|uniref:carbohydrate kinase family protein n=1 Tax=Sphingopyxis sp. DBS4 TaxID=2968500 RepID=UPI00214B5091|nr:carbohydrate kinase family protein [Sphingopyxis sp. DBS4]